MVKEIKNWVLKYAALTENNMPCGELIIYNTNGEHIELDNNLASLLGISNDGLMRNANIRKLNSPSTYFIHCELIDKENNLFNGKPSSLFANFDIKGKAFEKVSYQSEPQHVLFDTSTDKYINSLFR